METYTRNTKFTDALAAYCYHHKESDFMEVCEWRNGEGFDVTINDKTHFSLTWGEFECLQTLVNFKG